MSLENSLSLQRKRGRSWGDWIRGDLRPHQAAHDSQFMTCETTQRVPDERHKSILGLAEGDNWTGPPFVNLRLWLLDGAFRTKRAGQITLWVSVRKGGAIETLKINVPKQLLMMSKMVESDIAAVCPFNWWKSSVWHRQRFWSWLVEGRTKEEQVLTPSAVAI